jgi:hypothetical protein
MAKNKKRGKRLTDQEIIGAIEANLQNSTGFKDTKLSQERQQVLDYYHGKLPRPMHKGNSKYVSMDVYDTVEAMKGSLLEVFSANHNVITFPAQGPEDVEPARIAGLYTDYVMFRQNNCYNIFQTVIQDGLMARVGTVKVYWDTWVEKTEKAFSDAPMEAMDMLIGDDSYELVEYSIDEDTGLVSGVVCEYRDCAQVRIECIPPEDLLISAREKDHVDPQFVGHKSMRMADEIREKYGLSMEEIQKLAATDIDVNSELEINARTDNLSQESFNAQREYQDKVRPIRVDEVYMKIDRDGTGVRLWKFIKAGSHLLDEEQVDRHPFKFFVPLPVPHAFFGSNFAMKAVPIQNARTTLIRGILDHTVITNNPRTMVVKGALVNPREMLENRLGGVVNVTRPDGVFPYPQSNLNPFVFQTIGLLDEDKEDATGISKLSQGLNKDAISNQNSEGLVENLVSLSQQRQKIVARNFAVNFLVPLALEVYQLVLENEKTENIVELAGNWVPIDPQKWKERKDCSVALKLGYGEQAKEAQKWLVTHKFLSSDPSLSPMYPAVQRYNVIKKALEAEGVKDIASVIAAPPAELNQFQPPQPDPKLLAEIEELKARAAATQKKMELQEMEFGWQRKLDEANHELAKKEALLELVLRQREEERKDFEVKTKAEIAHRELDIVESTPPTEVKQSNIVSPNS